MKSLILLSLIASAAQAEPVSMFQERLEIECKGPAGTGPDRFVIDRKDTVITLYKGEKIVDEMERLAFLDTAFLVRSKSDTSKHALFQIMPNGSTTFLTGERLQLKEADCDDTGASKTCKNETFKKLFWSPEKVELEYAKGKVGGAIESYGFFANKATFFRSRASQKKNEPTLVLIDHGAPIDIVIGVSSPVDCHYRPLASP